MFFILSFVIVYCFWFLFFIDKRYKFIRNVLKIGGLFLSDNIYNIFDKIIKDISDVERKLLVYSLCFFMRICR